MSGEEWNGTHCVKCRIDHYKSVVGNNVSCEMCPRNETAPDVGYPACGKKSLQHNKKNLLKLINCTS